MTSSESMEEIEERFIEFDIAEEPEAIYKANRELTLAWRIVEETGANLFLTGRAGTGKTTFLKRLRERSGKRMVVLAPTGVAAINAGGNTLHSFFQLPFSPYVPGRGFAGEDKRFFKISKQKRRLISSLSLIVIDEVSMVRPDILDGIDTILRRYKNPTLPFGGVQMLLIGDIRQLPPVVKESEWELLSHHYPSPYFFESHALREAGFHTIELSTVYRQTEREFISILNDVRDGKCDAETLNALNSRYIPGFNPPDSEGYIRLTTHNRSANDFNRLRLEALPSAAVDYTAKIEGDFPESLYPAEPTLSLKPGAQVMFIKNDTGAERRFYNGMLGTVVELSDETVTVRSLSTMENIEIEPMEWENTRYIIERDSGDIRQETAGVFRQLPLRLAWAITIHKSQGLTFDKAIINAGHSFAPGQTYVALSRCRSLSGLVLDSPIPSSAIITDRNVNDFIDYCDRQAPDFNTLHTLRGEYMRQLLAELFDFTELKIAFNDFFRYVSEYIVPFAPEIEKPLGEALLTMANDIDGVGKKFINLYAHSPIDPDELGKNEVLLEKIRNGCAYFLQHLMNIARFIGKIPCETDNLAYNERLMNTYDTLSFRMSLKIRLLSILAEVPFTSETYVNSKAIVLLELEDSRGGAGKKRNSAGSAVAKKENREKPVKEKKEKKPKGYSANISLQLFREGKSIEEIANERNLAPSTVAGHLGAMIKAGRLEVEDVIPIDVYDAYANLIRENPDASFADIRRLADTLQTPSPAAPHWLSIAWHILRSN